jgi:hypothetical protein
MNVLLVFHVIPLLGKEKACAGRDRAGTGNILLFQPQLMLHALPVSRTGLKAFSFGVDYSEMRGIRQ